MSDVQTGTIGTRIPGRLERSPSSGSALFLYGYLIGAQLMIAAGIAEWFIGVEAAGRPLEDVAEPLTAEEAEIPA